MTPNFLAVALTAACLPFRNATLLKKSDKCVSFRLPIALAFCLKAIFNRLLPLGILLLSTLPPDILLFGASLAHETNCFDEFIRRFLLHVLPKGFFKVRYYGIFSSRHRKENIETARQLLAQETENKKEEALEDGARVWEKQDTVWDEILKLIKNHRQPNCPACKMGRLHFAGIVRKYPGSLDSNWLKPPFFENIEYKTNS